jgi:hypothetical protein
MAGAMRWPGSSVWVSKGDPRRLTVSASITMRWSLMWKSASNGGRGNP